MDEKKKREGNYHSLYDESYCIFVKQVLAKGGSLDKFAKLIGMSRTGIYKWMKAHPEFGKAVKDGIASRRKKIQIKNADIVRDGNNP